MWQIFHLACETNILQHYLATSSTFHNKNYAIPVATLSLWLPFFFVFVFKAKLPNGVRETEKRSKQLIFRSQNIKRLVILNAVIQRISTVVLLLQIKTFFSWQERLISCWKAIKILRLITLHFSNRFLRWHLRGEFLFMNTSDI